MILRRDLLRSLPLALTAQALAQESSGSQRYLLTFKAMPPHSKQERNFYELASTIKGFADHHGPFRESYGADTLTDQTPRYGVRSIVRATILKTTTSGQSPKSTQDGVYFITYDRVYKICAKTYSITGPKILYTDYETGAELDFPVRHRRLLTIHELKIEGPNILPTLWTEKMPKR